VRDDETSRKGQGTSKSHGAGEGEDRPDGRAGQAHSERHPKKSSLKKVNNERTKGAPGGVDDDTNQTNREPPKRRATREKGTSSGKDRAGDRVVGGGSESSREKIAGVVGKTKFLENPAAGRGPTKRGFVFENKKKVMCPSGRGNYEKTQKNHARHGAPEQDTAGKKNTFLEHRNSHSGSGVHTFNAQVGGGRGARAEEGGFEAHLEMRKFRKKN